MLLYDKESSFYCDILIYSQNINRTFNHLIYPKSVEVSPAWA